jgi:hypothetical protein
MGVVFNFDALSYIIKVTSKMTSKSSMKLKKDMPKQRPNEPPMSLIKETNETLADSIVCV